MRQLRWKYEYLAGCQDVLFTFHGQLKLTFQDIDELFVWVIVNWRGCAFFDTPVSKGHVV